MWVLSFVLTTSRRRFLFSSNHDFYTTESGRSNQIHWWGKGSHSLGIQVWSMFTTVRGVGVGRRLTRGPCWALSPSPAGHGPIGARRREHVGGWARRRRPAALTPVVAGRRVEVGRDLPPLQPVLVKLQVLHHLHDLAVLQAKYI